MKIQNVRSIVSKSLMGALVVTFFAINVQANPAHGITLPADTSKMSHAKMSKKKMQKAKMSKDKMGAEKMDKMEKPASGKM